MRNLFCFFSERRGRYKRRSECEFPSDTKEHPSEKNTPSERERIDDVNVNVDEEEEEDKEEEEEKKRRSVPYMSQLPMTQNT